jgi:hypothetical protein
MLDSLRRPSFTKHDDLSFTTIARSVLGPIGISQIPVGAMERKKLWSRDLEANVPPLIGSACK